MEVEWRGNLFFRGSVVLVLKETASTAISLLNLEYVATAEVVNWINFLQQGQIFICQKRNFISIGISEDNGGAIKLENNPIRSKITMHIDVKYNLIRDAMEEKKINIAYSMRAAIVGTRMFWETR